MRANHGRSRPRMDAAVREVAFVPTADEQQDATAGNGAEREPRDAGLTSGHHDKCGKQRTDRGTGVSTHLEQRLRKAVASAGSDSRDPRRFGMEDGRTDADKRRGSKNLREATGKCQP